MVSVTHAISQGDTAPPIDLLAAGLEPTEREHIEAALADYDGALIVASHDEDFLDAIGIERAIELTPARDAPP